MWLNLTPVTPKIAGSIIHPWPVLQCWLAQEQTAPGLGLSGQTPGSEPQLCPGLAPFGGAAIARLRGPLLPQEGDRRSQSPPRSEEPTSGTATLSTSIFFVDLPLKDS